MKMKKNDIIIIVVCTLVIGGVLLFLLGGFSKKPTIVQGQNTENINFTGDFDNSKIDDLIKRKDYGSIPKGNIGRQNPFAGF